MVRARGSTRTMLTHQDSRVIGRLLLWQRKNILIFASLSVAVVLAEQLTDAVAGLLPTAPITVLGSAIGIYVSFRSSSAYDRWWEARKLWGQLVNSSRHLTAQVIAYLPGRELRDARRGLVLRQALYAHVLRCDLRHDQISDDPDVDRLISVHEIAFDVTGPGTTTRLLRAQLSAVAAQHAAGKLDPRMLQSLDQTLAALLDVQGGCERIRNTPLPPGYARIAELLIRIYAVLLPLGIIGDLHWLAIPVSIVVCLSFKLISEVGRVLEDPFGEEWDALPLRALSTTIERNLLDAIGEEPPPAAQPDEHGVLM
ncbi:MAG: bestrophin family ion channel [Polyangiales bacterium]